MRTIDIHVNLEGDDMNISTQVNHVTGGEVCVAVIGVVNSLFNSGDFPAPLGVKLATIETLIKEWLDDNTH